MDPILRAAAKSWPNFRSKFPSVDCQNNQSTNRTHTINRATINQHITTITNSSTLNNTTTPQTAQPSQHSATMTTLNTILTTTTRSTTPTISTKRQPTQLSQPPSPPTQLSQPPHHNNIHRLHNQRSLPLQFS